MHDSCNSCGKKLYGYGDGVHEIWLCYKCGKFVGSAGGDALFGVLAKSEPEIILTMIQEKLLIPIEKTKHDRFKFNR